MGKKQRILKIIENYKNARLITDANHEYQIYKDLSTKNSAQLQYFLSDSIESLKEYKKYRRIGFLV